MKISHIITLSFIVLAVLSSVIGNYYLYNSSSGILRQQIIHHLESVAESRANHIETYLEQNIERLELVTSRTKLRDTLKNYNEKPNEEDKATVTKIITDAKEPISEFERICVISPDGIVITSTDDSYCGTDVSDSEFFTQGKLSSNVYFMNEKGIKKIFVTGPLMLDGELIGVGLTVVDTGVLESIVRDRGGLGETGEVLIAVKDGEEILFLFERLFEEDALNQSMLSAKSAEPMRNALNANELVFENSLDYRDEPVIAISQYVPLGGVGLVAKIDVAEAIDIQRRELLRSSIIMILFVLLFVSTIGFIISRQVSYPIKNLTQEVDSITQGNLDIQLDQSSINEVHDLTESLNRILASLKLAILRTGMTKEEMGLKEIFEAKEKAEKELLESEKKYKQLFDSAGSAIVILDLKANIVDVNNIIEEYGFKREDLIGQNQLKFIPKKYWPKLALDNKKTERGESSEGEIEIKTSKGNVFVEYHTTPIRENGKVVGGQVILINITERKKAEDKIKLFSEAVEDALDGITLTDMHGVITYVNPAMERIHGFRKEELIGKNINEIYDKETVDDMMDTLGKIGYATSETKAFNKAKRTFPVLLSLSAVKDKEGNPIAIMISDRDISKRKAIEKQLKESEQKLKEAQELAHIGHWSWDLKAETLTWSDEVYRIFGVKKSKFKVTTKNFEKMIHPDDLESFLQEREKALEAGRKVDVEHRIIKADGEVRIVHELATIVKDDKDKPIRVLGTVQDITERKGVEN